MSFKKYNDGMVNYIVEYFDCSCFSSEHLIKFVIDPIEKEMYLEVHLNHCGSIFTRMWKAIKFIFGYRSKYGDFDCFNFQDGDVENLRKFLDEYNKVKGV